MRIDEEKFLNASEQLKTLMIQVLTETSLEELRGLEGAGAAIYFRLFDDMILRNKESFLFQNRNRRPPVGQRQCSIVFCLYHVGQ